MKIYFIRDLENHIIRPSAKITRLQILRTWPTELEIDSCCYRAEFRNHELKRLTAWGSFESTGNPFSSFKCRGCPFFLCEDYIDP